MINKLPSRTEEPEGTGFNPNPSSLSTGITTGQDLNGRVISRVLLRIASNEVENMVECPRCSRESHQEFRCFVVEA